VFRGAGRTDAWYKGRGGGVGVVGVVVVVVVAVAVVAVVVLRFGSRSSQTIVVEWILIDIAES